MTEDPQPRQRNHKQLWLALAVLAAILAVLIVPPLVSVTRYKAQITRLISASLGRPVRLSSVEVRILPRPGFVLTDLTVEEDPAYGAEPVLHANSVSASIRLLSLWRGRLEIDTISLDEATLNIVRTAAGRWNLDPLLRTATAQTQSDVGSAKLVKLPYLEAANSRINIKNGEEKLPFSLLNAEMSLSQETPGDWRVRLRGRPVRTDLSIQQADTGIVRLEANLHQAPQLRQMPVHLDLEWSEAQLGQLTRLLLGSDAGWRGDLTGELQLDGIADAAKIKAQLRAIGVHREEFAPAAPVDFDANCSLVADFSTRVIDNLVCDSPLGDGRIRLTGNLPGDGPGQAGMPSFSVELDRIPVAAGLDALRTVRSGLGPGLEAAGSVSGKITYAPVAPEIPALEKRTRLGSSRSPNIHPVAQGPFTGALVVQGFELRGTPLSAPIRVPRLLLEPSFASANQPSGAFQALGATVAIPAGGTAPLTVTTRLALSGYQVALRGQASVARVREMAHAAGLAESDALDALAGDPISIDLTAEGPWIPIQVPIQMPIQATAAIQPPPADGISLTVSAPPPGTATDTLTGTVILHNANWKADYLANHLEISQATLHLASGEMRWSPVVFSYGPLKGIASLTLPAACDAAQSCPPTFQVQLGALDAALLQTAFLGAHEKSTLLSTLIDRLRSTAAPAWPQLVGTIKAESLILGPVTLQDPAATLRMLPKGAEITAFDAGLLGGRIQGTGTLHTAISAQDKPSYEFEGTFEKLSPPEVGQLLGLRASGEVLDGAGKVELSGFTGSDLAASAKGALHFEWRHGTVAATSASGPIPPVLARFDLWSGDAVIANGTLTLKENLSANQVKLGPHTFPVQATVTLADPPKIIFAAPRPVPAAPKAAQSKR